MRKTPISLKIENPCHENWDLMKPQEQGRYCNQCAQTVIDFTQLSDYEILKIIEKSSTGLCGRVTQEQLNTPLETIQTPGIWGKMYQYVLSALLFLNIGNAEAQTYKAHLNSNTKKVKPKINKISPKRYIVPLSDREKNGTDMTTGKMYFPNNKAEVVENKKDTFVFHGNVKDDSGKNLSDAFLNFYLKNIKIGYGFSDHFGNYKIESNATLKLGDTLFCSISFKSRIDRKKIILNQSPNIIFDINDFPSKNAEIQGLVIHSRPKHSWLYKLFHKRRKHKVYHKANTPTHHQ